MRVGVPAEVKVDEYRVALGPAGANELVRHGHDVWVEHRAGEGSDFSDAAYERVGARIGDAAAAWGCDLVLKVKEPQPAEFGYLHDDQVLFTYLHLAANPGVADALRRAGTTAIAYETVEDRDGRLPLLAPMSEIAGRLAVQAGARHLEKPHGGRGVLLPVHGNGPAREQEARDERVPEEGRGGEEVHLPIERGGDQQRVDEVVRVIDAEEHRPRLGHPVGVAHVHRLEEEPDAEAGQRPHRGVEGAGGLAGRAGHHSDTTWRRVGRNQAARSTL